jgi:hypothetical protein
MSPAWSIVFTRHARASRGRSVVGFLFEEENEGDDEDDLMINNAERQAILKIRKIAGS